MKRSLWSIPILRPKDDQCGSFVVAPKGASRYATPLRSFAGHLQDQTTESAFQFRVQLAQNNPKDRRLLPSGYIN